MLIRRDIREGEGEAGIPLLLDFQFIDVNTCKPVPDAMIDIWHANSTGVYSGYEAEGTADETYLRGLQPTDNQGIMQMITSVPGFYSGRATHIHMGAHIGGYVDEENEQYVGGNTTHIGKPAPRETSSVGANKIHRPGLLSRVHPGIGQCRAPVH